MDKVYLIRYDTPMKIKFSGSIIQKFLCMVLSCVLFSSCSSSGWRLKGDEFPKSYEQETQVKLKGTAKEVLTLRGVGVKTLFMVRVFIASLYLPSHVPSSDAMETDVSKHLSVVFYISFSAKDFFDFTLDHMKPNLTQEEFQLIQPQLDQMKTFSPAIKSGDTFALSYMPEEGTKFIVNGKFVGIVAGEGFSKAIFSTWIGEKPFDYIVKRQILGIQNARR